MPASPPLGPGSQLTRLSVGPSPGPTSVKIWLLHVTGECLCVCVPVCACVCVERETERRGIVLVVLLFVCTPGLEPLWLAHP